MNPANLKLLEWFNSEGGTVDTSVMGICDFPGQGRGGIALKDINVTAVAC